MRAIRTTAAGLLVFVSAVAASAGEPRPAGEAAERYYNDTTLSGTRGLWRVEAARPLRQGELVIGLNTSFFSADDFLVSGDSHQRVVTRGFVASSPWESLDLAVSWAYFQNDNDAFNPKRASYAGDPSFNLKFSKSVTQGVNAGVGAVVTVPTSANGRGLASEATTLSGYGAVSWSPNPAALLAFNVGYRYDQTNKIFKRDLTPAQRFAAGISRVNSTTLGLGGRYLYDATDWLAVGPFAEVSAQLAQGVPMDRDPIRASFGLKTLFISSRRLELDIVGDVRLAGKPASDGKLPGIPPYEVFAQLVGHLDFIGEPVEGGPRACSASAACPSGLSCIDGFCAVVKEITKETVIEKEKLVQVEKKTETFSIAGTVVDADTGEGIGGAEIRLAGAESAIAADAAGKFKSWELPVAEGLLQVTAASPGFKPTQEMVPKNQIGTKEITLKLVRLGKDLPGQLKGSLKDARTGKAVKAATVVIPATGMKFKTDKEGQFTAELKPGRYQLLISSGKHETQSKDIEIRAGEVVIMNVDMTPKRR